MRAASAMVTFALTICVDSAFAGDAAEAKLPPEGAWARYHILTKPENGPELTLKSTLKFLGQQEHNGVICRWLEIEERYQGVPGQTHRFLVPERALRESPNPLAESVVANYRNEDGEIQPLRLEMAQQFGAYLLSLPAMRKEAKAVHEPMTVDYQQGRLVIPTGHRGEFRWSREAITAKQTQTFLWNYTVWIDPKVVAGIARGRWTRRFETEEGDRKTVRTWTVEQYLEDFGLDAKSAFP